MADQEMEDAMIIIQEASAKIAKVSEKLSGLETISQEVVAALKDLSNKVANLENGRLPNGEKSQTNKAPLYIRNLVRAVYKDFSHTESHQFILVESFSGAHNQQVTSSITQEVLARQPSAKEEDIRAACARYYRSLYEDRKRELSGTKIKHRESQRRLGRKKTKLQNRRRQFQNGVSAWFSTRKERIKFILGEGLPYISSEESGEEDDRPVYLRRPLTWLKPKYRKSLRHLDKLHYQSLSAKSKQMYRIRCDGVASQRSPPAGVPTYLLVEDDDDDLNSSIASNGTE